MYMQCAAVKIQCWFTIEPPQMCLLPGCLSDTIYGNCPSNAVRPPTIRILDGLLKHWDPRKRHIT